MCDLFGSWLGRPRKSKEKRVKIIKWATINGPCPLADLCWISYKGFWSECVDRSMQETCYGYGCDRLKVLMYTSIMQVLLSEDGLGFKGEGEREGRERTNILYLKKLNKIT